MKDPKVIELVKQFKVELTQLNKTWHKLQTEGMYVDVSAEGTHSYTDPKSFVIKRMTQSIEYFKEVKNVG
jgi:hypothetical protein